MRFEMLMQFEVTPTMGRNCQAAFVGDAERAKSAPAPRAEKRPPVMAEDATQNADGQIGRH